ncbi:MAG: hypothetical protein SFY70_04570 [Bacteroidia bacterium]|nr:hypothetical protein [Bacteroidia bacterium]
MLRCTHFSHGQVLAVAPLLTLPRVGGGHYTLQPTARAARTWVIFHRGLSCEVCNLYLSKLAILLRTGRYPDLQVVLVSRENESVATQLATELGLPASVVVLYGLTLEQAAAWEVISPQSQVVSPTVFNLCQSLRILQRCTLSDHVCHIPRLRALEAALERRTHPTCKDVRRLHPPEPSGAGRSLQGIWWSFPPEGSSPTIYEG